MHREEGSDVFYGFVAALRAEGMTIGTDQVQSYLRALEMLTIRRRADVFWSGRATLCSAKSDFEAYDRTFHTWFFSREKLNEFDPAPRSVNLPDEGKDTAISDEREQEIAQASREELLQHRDIAQLLEAEQRYLATAFATLQLRAPLRRSRYQRTHRHKIIDPTQTIREQLRRCGEPGGLHYRQRSLRPRKVVLIIDVSGSMQPYADSFLRFGHRFLAVAPDTVEVFTIGTRLTRVTSALKESNADRALAAAGLVVPDWSGGTRLGTALQAFVELWGQHTLLRRSVVIIASDGWERGDSRDLGVQVARIRKLTHSIVWCNPHRGKPGYEPIQSGIKAVLPHIDEMVAGHSLAAFKDLAERIGHA